MKERHVYQGIIVVLLVFFVFFFMKSHENYMGLLNSTKELDTLLNEQKDSYEGVIEQWSTKYEELSSDYGNLLSECGQLESEIDQLEIELNEIELPVYDFSREEIYLLAKCVQAEAGDYKGHELSQRYITQVILNRIHSGEFPNTIEDVIYQKVGKYPQFSVAYNGMMEDAKVEPETLANVYRVIVHGTDLPEYVCYFYSKYTTGKWVNTLPTYDVVEGTVFAYKEVDKEE